MTTTLTLGACLVDTRPPSEESWPQTAPYRTHPSVHLKRPTSEPATQSAPASRRRTLISVGAHTQVCTRQRAPAIAPLALISGQNNTQPGRPEKRLSGAICVQKLDDSRVAGRINFRTSLRSSSTREPSDPLLAVVFSIYITRT